ncbi:MAG: hypothetical protein JWQ87_2816 [Candidatus Sulfotelmatobacter sp.]|nr:hypothetical protein [Candidatus Sulfotelmatobacter sp.]
MKSTAFGWTVLTIAVLVLAASVGALAQTSAQPTFSGEINAYSPQSTGSTGTTGPYEIRGPWSLTLEGNSTANFSTDLNMEESDGWCITQNGSNFDPAARGAHTHHVTLVNAVVTQITNGFQISGSATIMSNGTISSKLSPSVLTVQITGGTDRKYSNVTLTFQTPASDHFGTEPVAGVVRSVKVSGSKARK